MPKAKTVVTIDVVIPSFRLIADKLLPILNLKGPADAVIKYYLIADNPEVIPPTSILSLVDNENIFLTINAKNEGASATRNKGIDSGQGDWILFLDDDIDVRHDLLFAYTNAIAQNPGEIGFIGVVDLPPATTSFAHAVNANGSMTMFTIARHQPSYAWGVTANLMINRKATGNVRFSLIYPKTGGGEDVEFCLRIREANNFKNFKCITSADVVHPWWNNGKPDVIRFYRYGQGISFLPQRNPLYRSYNFLNPIEATFVTTLIFLGALALAPHNRYLIVFPFFVLLTVVLEYIISLRIALKYKQGNSPSVAAYVMLIRNYGDAGVFLNNMARYRIWGIGERFHFNGRTTRSNFGLNTNKIIKLVIYLIAGAYAFYVL